MSSSSPSSLSIYDLSVPILVRNLEILQTLLHKGEQWAKDNNKDPQSLLSAFIVSDMKPLIFQIQTCSNTAKAILFRVGGETNTPMEDDETTLADVHARLSKTIALLRAAKKEKFSAPTDACKLKVGTFDIDFTALEYIQKFVLPNFFFHHTTAYDILRKEGVPIGKADYLGGGDLSTWSL